jgi:predicted aconitase
VETEIIIWAPADQVEIIVAPQGEVVLLGEVGATVRQAGEIVVLAAEAAQAEDQVEIIVM